MKKFKTLVLLTLGLMLYCIQNVTAATTVENENELTACMASATEKECVLGENITLSNILAVKDYDKILDLNGKHLSLPKTTVDGVKLTINDSGSTGKYSTNEYGIYAFDNGTVIVNGGNFETKYAVLSGNNTKGDVNFEVNGGVLTTFEGPAIYMPSQVKLTITDGIINGGVSARMGQITITGGTINNSSAANTDTIEEYYSYSGNVFYGSAITLLPGTYTSANTTYGNSLNLTISGGKFNSTMGDALVIYGLGKVEQEVNVAITGGTFNGKNADVVSYDVTKEAFVKANYKEFTNINNVTITGGTFTHNVEDYLATGYVQNNVNNTYVVKANVVIDATDKDGNTIASFESEKPLPKDYKLTVLNKDLEDAKKANLTNDAKDLITKSYGEVNVIVNDTKILGTYDISVFNGNNIVKIDGTDSYKISLKVDLELFKSYKYFKVVYISDDGVVSEPLNAQLDNDNLVFNTTHLSTYAIVGYNVEEVSEENPKTVDTIIVFGTLGAISLIGLVTASIYFKNKQLNK